MKLNNTEYLFQDITSLCDFSTVVVCHLSLFFFCSTTDLHWRLPHSHYCVRDRGIVHHYHQSFPCTTLQPKERFFYPSMLNDQYANYALRPRLSDAQTDPNTYVPCAEKICISANIIRRLLFKFLFVYPIPKYSCQVASFFTRSRARRKINRK